MLSVPHGKWTWNLTKVRLVLIQIFRSDWIQFKGAVVTKVHAILMHVMVWVNPMWSYPSPASQRLKDFQWKTEIADLLFADDPNNLLSCAEQLIKAIVDKVEGENMWQDATQDSLISDSNYG